MTDPCTCLAEVDAKLAETGHCLDATMPAGALRERVPDREPDGEFHCFQTWVNKAASWIGGTNPLCLDAKDRRCRTGADMMRARDESAFPVRFWFGEGGQSPAEQRKAKRAHRATMKLNYPWRFR